MESFLTTAMGRLAGGAYLLLSLAIAWSALKHRGEGWRTAAIFAALTLTIPGWVMGGFWLCQSLGLLPMLAGQVQN